MASVLNIFVGTQMGKVFFKIFVLQMPFKKCVVIVAFLMRFGFFSFRFFISFPVTRSRKRLFESNGVKECFVAIPIGMKTDVLGYLHATDPKTKEIVLNKNHYKAGVRQRSASVSGAPLFSVDGEIQEHSSDYLEPVYRSGNLTKNLVTSLSTNAHDAEVAEIAEVEHEIDATANDNTDNMVQTVHMVYG